MVAIAILVLCAQALFIQSTFSQCVNRGVSNPALQNQGYPYDSVPGGGFPMSSSSPIGPTGLTIVSENIIEGTVTVIGELPFLSAVALQGALPTAGLGVIDHGCGNGVTGMVNEGLAPAVGAGYGAPYAPANRLGYGYD